MAAISAAHVEMVSLLRRTDLLFISHDLHAIFAQAAIHRRLSRNAFGSPSRNASAMCS
jgi:hypothetical protein